MTVPDARAATTLAPSCDQLARATRLLGTWPVGAGTEILGFDAKFSFARGELRLTVRDRDQESAETLNHLYVIGAAGTITCIVRWPDPPEPTCNKCEANLVDDVCDNAVCRDYGRRWR